MKISQYIFILALSLLLFASINSQGQQPIAENKGICQDSEKFIVKHPEWAKNATIYEVNVRQYTKSGTFKEFENHLPRLKKLGVDILWFMPVHPIGKQNRKGQLGSYYSVRDYKAINPEFGTMADFKRVVNKAHKMGMYVIIDWVANHTAWDHAWTISNPEFYTKDSSGHFIPPIGTDWSDAIDLNYDNPALRKEMISSLQFWIDSANIDGFRCDVADWVPLDFWDQARAELDKIKPVFMLAEAERPVLHHKAFDASYGWEFHHIMHSIAKKEKQVGAIDSFFTRETANYDKNAIRMQFITNHDENSWNGTVKEKFGQDEKTFAVLTYTLPGMPLIYSGQEAGLDKRLKFFEKDEIDWNQDKELAKFYLSLNQLKKKNPALWNGNNGAPLQRIKTSQDMQVFAFLREKDQNQVLVIVNLSDKEVNFQLNTQMNFNLLKEYFSKENYKGNQFTLKPWEYKVYVK